MNHRSRVLTVMVIATLAVAAPAPAGAALEMGPAQLVSTNAQGEHERSVSVRPLPSGDGRFVAFGSGATNLVPDDTNATTDVFVKDLSDGSVERISVDEQGSQLSGRSYPISMSSDGRYVLFANSEPIEGSDGSTRLWMRLGDRTSEMSRRIDLVDRSGDPIALQSYPRLSGNARFLAFSTSSRLVRNDRDDHDDVYRFDLTTGAVRRVSVTPRDAGGIPGAGNPVISHSGRVIAFTSDARLVRRDRRDYNPAVYVRDMRQRRPRLVSQNSSGVQANRPSSNTALSANGRYVLFTTRASNLVRRDTNRKQDVYLRDRRTGAIKRVSVNSRERQGNQHSGYEAASVSNDGQLVVFDSQATNLAPGTSDFVDAEGDGSNIFVRDRRAGTTTAVTMAADGTGANGTSGHAVISRDGSTVAFFSYASNLVEGADPGVGVYRRRLASTGR